MDRPQRLEIDDVVDLVLPVNDDEYQEAVGGQPADGLDGDGMPLGQGEDPTGPNQNGLSHHYPKFPSSCVGVLGWHV